MRHPPSRESAADEPGRSRPLTVAHWLTLLLVAFFVGPMYVSNLWGYLQSRRYMTDAAFVNIRNVAALEASETREFVRAAEGVVYSIVAGNHYMYQLIRLLRDTDEDRELMSGALQGHLIAKAAEGASFREYLVLSPSGRLLASSEPSGVLDSDLSGHRCFKAGISKVSIVGFEVPEERHGPGRNGHSHSEASGDDSGDAPNLLIAGPIHDNDGSLLGVFCGRFSFDVHHAMMIANRDLTNQASVYLVNEHRRVVCGSFANIRTAPYGDTLFWLDELGLEKGAAWEGKRRGKDGAEILVAYSPVPSLGWGVVVEAPEKHALADLERLKWQAVTGSGILAVILALAAFLSWRTFVTPLQALSRASERMASGDPGETVSPGGPREIADLAATFNRMSLALRESQENLESRIAERTLALRESREFLELLLDSIDQRVIVVSRDHEIIKANTAAVRMHGQSLLGKRWYEVFEGLSEPPAEHPMCHTFDTGEIGSDERSQQTVGGNQPVYVETYPIFEASGAITSVIEIGRVVTAEKQHQMQMVYQEKMTAFGQLAAGIAHEIGNPLAAIDSQLQLAQSDPDRAAQTLAIVRKQVGRMDRMLRRLVNFSRRRRDEVMLASANQVVDDVAQLMEHDPRAREVTITRRLSEHVPGIRIKEDDLVQVLLNLGLNALDAVGKDGTVEFETGVDDGVLVIRVSDNGGGIPDAAVGNVFDPFFTTKGPGKGTGLGLFVSRGIIQGIGGILELERTGPDGTTFSIRLPLKREGLNGAGI